MRYSKIYALLLAAMVTAGSVSTAMAQSGGPTVHGNVYGGGNAADVNVNTTVNITGGQIGGSTVNAEHGNVFGGGKGQNTTVKGDVSVNIGKAPEGSVTTYTGTGIVKGSVYGGSALGYVNANTTKGTDGTVTAHTANTDKTTQVNVFKGTVKENVYGGGRGEKTTSNDISATSASAVTVTIGANATEAAPAIDGSVYGGSDANGVLESDVTLHILNGTIGKETTESSTTTISGGNVYGGGLGLPTLVQGSVTVNIGAAGTTPTGTANILGDVYGGSAKGKVNATKGGTAASPTYSKTDSKTTQVNLYSNTGVRNVYGGGHGLDGASADVYGDVTVNIGATDGASTPTYTGNATINGSVFGCNNANGSPQGDVTVNVYKTAQTEKEAAAYTSSDATYAIDQVFGGGNEANYNPLETTNKAQVHIFTCLNTVKTVYGGGNAANGTNVGVTIDGGRFNRVFGGGNGEDSSKPAANISGSAITQVHGGYYDQVFGGSNSRGDVNSASLTLDNTSSCGDLVINNSFGGANEAEISGDIETTLICSSDPNSTFSIGSFYGGSNKADIDGSVTLNVYGGTYTNVFGGSKGDLASLGTKHITKAANISGDVTLNLYGGNITNAFGGSDVNGNITGKITVNVLDYQSNTCPLSITNIYGAGNLTAYTPNKVSDEVISSPEINVIHMKEGSSITGNVYGGGKGDADHNALVTANPIVNIGYDATTMSSLIPADFLTTANLSSTDAFIANVSGNVYGGGDLAGVTGNTTVYLRKANTSVGGSLFGGGNEAVVSGNTSVNVVNGTVTQDVYGGGALANVGTDASNTTQVTITDGTITGDVYGGGLGQLSKAAVLYTAEDAEVIAGTKQVGDVKEGAKEAIAALVNGAVTVNVNGGSVDEVFGCNNLNGAPQSTVEVNITNGNITNVFGGGNQAAYTGTPDVNISGGTITKVFGGGNEAGTGGSDVAITAGTISGGVYGGCNTSGTITGNTTVTLTGGTIGADNALAEVCGGGLGKDTKVHNSTTPCTSYVYVGTATTPGDASTYTGGTTLYGDIYGGSAYGEVDNTEVNLFKLADTSFGYNVFGGGKGKADDTGNIEAKVKGTATVNMYALTITGTDEAAAVYGGCNVNGTATAAIVNLIGGTIGTAPTSGTSRLVNKVFGGGKGNSTTTTTATVNVGTDASTGSSNIYSNVYGGSALGAVGTTNVNLNKVAALTGDVFGGGMGRYTEGAADNAQATVTVTATVNLNDGFDLAGNIYGGCNIYGETANAEVNLIGGTVGTETANSQVYGGGKGAKTTFTTYNSETGKGTIAVNLGSKSTDATPVYSGTSHVYGKIYGGSENGSVQNVDVNLYGGIVTGDVFGGGYDTTDPTTVAAAKDVKVTLDGAYVSGSIFGCNDTNGSPSGTAEVHIYKTVHLVNGVVKDVDPGPTEYELQAVYGGGNEASTSGGTKVVINTCDPSIRTVYGGGNAADVGSTDVTVNGAHEIGTLFGGGNGSDTSKPGANVNGQARATLHGGKIHVVYGGSNENGDVIGGTYVDISDAGSTCTLDIGEVYGAGNNAGMQGGANIIMGCQPDNPIEDVYAGAKNADVGGNVSLTITSGKFGRVFGGNKFGGLLKGSITLNIEESGESCGTPIVIGELYSGGNLADYSVYGYDTSGKAIETGTSKTYSDPQLNIRSFTSIGAVYGGGFRALMVADPTVNINVVKGSHYNDNDLSASSFTGIKIHKKNTDGTIVEDGTVSLSYPAHVKGAIGAIGNVFGGGNEAKLVGSATVNIGTETSIGLIKEPTHLIPSGSTSYPKNAETGKYDVAVEGANITGNVYGGGNQADVTGDTQVNICAKETGTGDDKTWTGVTPGTAGVTIGENVFGGGKGIASDVTKAHVSATNIHIGNGAIKKSVYGGGELAQVEGNTNVTVMGGTIGTAKADLPSGVTMGEVYGNIYGGGMGNTTNSAAGQIKGNSNVNVSGNPTILHNIYGGGAYGSVGDFTFTTGAPSAYGSGGTANVTITGGTIGTDGHENGMVFGSSRGNVAKPDGTPAVDPNDKLAWVYDANVIIGTSGATTGPQINGSVYGSGENGHTYNNTDIKIYSGTIGINSSDNVTIYDLLDNTKKVYEGKAYNYPYRGNVYGGGCGTDMYDSDANGTDDMYNPLAGIVRGAATVTITGGQVVHNVYGAGAMGSVGEMNATGAIISGGTTTIAISGGIVGVEGAEGGNVFGAARGDANAPKGVAQVKSTGLSISNGIIYGNVYGGGALGDVGTYTYDDDTKEYTWDKIGGQESGDCSVEITGGTVKGHVFGAGKGEENTFECEKAMVRTTSVSISAGTVEKNVYGGGEVGRVDQDAAVTVGPESGDGAPVIKGNVFGAGAGVETHGYSALVRGNTTVIVQGSAKVGQDVYGGGQIAAVGRYGLTNGMPTTLVSGGECKVTVKGNAEIGTDGEGHVFGAGMGVTPHYYPVGVDSYENNADKPKRMMTYTTTPARVETDAGTKWDYYGPNHNYVWEYLNTRDDYLNFLQTLALVTDTKVSIEGSAKVHGSVYGGSKSGFVQRETDVKIKGGTILTITDTDNKITEGNVFGGGKGLSGFDAAGRVRGDATTTISGGTINGNVYGGGELGFVGTVTTEDHKNYTWYKIHDDDDHYSGLCTVIINNASVEVKGNVFGASKGKDDTFECEQGMTRTTSVSISAGTVDKNVYGGGEVGRVDQDAAVTIGPESGDGAPVIKGNVFGAGAGVETHGYSALVRGDAEVIVQGGAKVGKNVYGGGEIAAVGRYGLTNGMPTELVSGGECKVTIKGNAEIGTISGGHVFGAGMGVDETKKTYTYSAGNTSTMPKRMMIYDTSVYKSGYENPYEVIGNTGYVWEYYPTRNKYLAFLQTLALATDTKLSIEGNAKVKGSVYGGSESGFVQRDTEVKIQGATGTNGSIIDGNIYGGGKGLSGFDEAGRVRGGVTVDVSGSTMRGSVYGGGELGIVVGAVKVDINNGTIEKDVYGGGALANTNTNNWDGTTLTETYLEASTPTIGTSVVGYYTKSGDNYNEAIGTAAENTTYYRKVNTSVNLLGGIIKGDAYGGGLGQLGTNAIEAKVYGDVTVTLGDDGRNGATAFYVDKYTEGTHAGIVKSGRVFGCNNLNGSPQGSVTVTVNKTAKGNIEKTASEDRKKENATHSYHVAAVYGGGNLAGKTVGDKTNVIINGCDVSIRQVYGGGNAAEVPGTDVLVNGTWEIEQVFGGGNGKDDYTLDGGTTWITNPGANVNGNTNTLMKGGLIHEAYGGSNEKGTITGSVSINTSDDRPTDCDCELDVEKIVGAGKNADVDGDLIMVLGCKPTTETPLVFGGADNANVNGNVELTITSGTFGKVFGGNNLGGIIKGHILLNIEETGCNPINIKELYLGGNQAAYSVYGYYDSGSTDPVTGKTVYKPRTSESDSNPAVTNPDNTDKKHPFPYAQPVLNVVSCTSIGKVFGGGLGEGAVMYADPTVNINMIPGDFASDDSKGVPFVMNEKGLSADDNPKKLGIIGDVYGGGNAADVIGNPTVNIGTAATVQLHQSYSTTTGYVMSDPIPVEGAYINGNVFGGGMGSDDTYECEKAMVGKDGDGKTHPNGGTSVIIGNGTVEGSVYGGGEVGRVEKNTVVTIGLDYGTGTPVIEGNVFGAGQGKKTHGYSALVRGNSTVTVQGSAKVKGSVYGGGEIATVGRYKVDEATGMPTIPDGGGMCTVVIKDNAVIGPDANMVMNNTTTHKPDDAGHVFGAGKGVLPYEGYGDDEKPFHWDAKKVNGVWEDDKKWYKAYNNATPEDIDEYFTFIKTLALVNETSVTIGGNALVKGGVYGGSENGFVQTNTNVTIQDNCQIGLGKGQTAVYSNDAFINPATTEVKPANALAACDAWPYGNATGNAKYAPYDPYALASGYYSTTESDATSAKGGYPVGDDGHTFYGNVFAGGSGYYPYRPGKWFSDAGQVRGNANLTITGGHILSNVYGGNEMTDVLGNSTITMSGGTVGVPRDATAIAALPTVGHLYGAGKGDKRIFFNTSTNVNNTTVNITGGTIYGNVYGGGEDGHVMSNATMTVNQAEGKTTVIGSTGTSDFDGDVFGGGQGSVTALTAGVVGGNVNLNIVGGSILGSAYGGGRIASVGTYFAMAKIPDPNDPTKEIDNPNYGKMQADENGITHGHIAVNLIGGTIRQNVYGGCMGTAELDANNKPQDDLGVSKTTKVNLNGVPYTDVAETQTLYTTGWGLVKDEASSGTPYVVPDASKGCVVKGSIFGCNNVYSSPQGAVLVHVYKTQRDDATRITNGGDEKNAKDWGRKDEKGNFILSSFDVQSVYGGGNLAAYEPVPTKTTGTDEEKEASKPAPTVIIDGCGRTSIGHVYGGGNAAPTPATNVTVNGTFEIGELFGGGNGADKLPNGDDNPGANVGFRTYPDNVKDKTDTPENRATHYGYGSGKAAVNVFGGTIRRVFGGSNTKGNVRLSAITLLEEAGGCDFCVDEAYGGGKSAAMDAEAKLLMACIPGLKEVYGGAQAADVYDDVSVTITNGNFDRVFGGNNLSGTIRGKITVNIEETGCRPVIIGELYGGGNLAGYSVYGYNADGSLITSGDTPLYADPEVNVKSFTSIGNIYGGGYGEGALMVGSPTVNINEVVDPESNAQNKTYKVPDPDDPEDPEKATTHYYSDYAGETKTIAGHEVILPSHAKGKMGSIYNVFGGGNAAKVIGNTNVNIGTEATQTFVSIDDNPETTDVNENVKTVVGADIRGNVYGGGNNAEVTGNTNVTIGQEKKKTE